MTVGIMLIFSINGASLTMKGLLKYPTYSEVVLIPSLPAPLARYAAEDATREITPMMWFSILGGSVALVLALWGSIQLFRLKRSGRPLFLIGAVGTILTTPFYGPVIFTPPGMLLYSVSDLFGGVVVGAVYFAEMPATARP